MDDNGKRTIREDYSAKRAIENTKISSLPGAALHWTISMPEVTTVIPGARTINELEPCIRGSDAVPFDQTTMDDVRAIQHAWGDWKIYG